MTYYSEHREECREYARTFNAKNPEYQRDYQSEYGPEYRANHMDEAADWRSANKEKIRGYPHSVRTKEQDAAMHAKRRGAEGHYTPKDVRDQFELQQGLCRYCVEPLTDYHVDHFIPIVRGGSNWPENITIACPACNLSKGSQLVLEWKTK